MPSQQNIQQLREEIAKKKKRIAELRDLYLSFKTRLYELEQEEQELVKEIRKAIDEAKLHAVLNKIHEQGEEDGV